MSDTTHDLEAAMLASLRGIATQWDAMLTPTSSGGHGGSQSARITADDHADTEADIDRTTRIVSLRRFTVDVLNGWSRVVMEDRPVTKALPDGSDAKGMCTFLERHAQWMSGHEAAEDCVTELAELAKKISNLVAPKRKEWHYLGDCPFVVGDWFCAGRVRVPIGGDQSEAACSDCDQSGPVRWWEDVLGIASSEQIVSAADMAQALHDRLHVTVTERTVRNWARAKRVTAFVPFGPEPKEPRWWFEVRTVLDEVARMDRECPMCGRAWSGQGDVCSRCYAAMRVARSRYAEAKRPTPVALSLVGWCPWPRNVVPDPHDTDRPERCHWSDLPLNQCACGRQHERMGA